MAITGLERFKTVVRNTSGKTRFFACLPPHGAELDPNEDWSYPGDLFSALDGISYWQRRDFEALATAVSTGALTIIETPIGVRFDISAGRVRQINVSGGTVTAVDPAAGSYFGSAPNYSFL